MNKKNTFIVVGIVTLILIIGAIIAIFLFPKSDKPKESVVTPTVSSTVATEKETVALEIEDVTEPTTVEVEEATEEGTYDKTADVKLEIIDGRENQTPSDDRNDYEYNNNNNISASRIN